MRLLYLIRHATPVVQPDTPARDWPLGERGVEEANALAVTARSWDLSALYSSSEPKARTTALIIGDAVGLDVNVVDAFDELRIPQWIGNADEFNDAVRAILVEASAAPRGAETAGAAADRFAGGIGLISQGPFPAALVSHGRILTAWLMRAVGIEDPFEVWRTMPMPGYACIDLDALGAGFIVPFAPSAAR